MLIIFKSISLQSFDKSCLKTLFTLFKTSFTLILFFFNLHINPDAFCIFSELSQPSSNKLGN